MAVEEWFDIYEKAARWREMARRIGDGRAAAALRALACELERKARRLINGPQTGHKRGADPSDKVRR